MKQWLGVIIFLIGLFLAVYIGVFLGLVGLVHLFTGVGSIFWNVFLIVIREIVALIVGGGIMFLGFIIFNQE